jgi:tRNA nucleotidyltransferase (CCA-adding enzyme)
MVDITPSVLKLTEKESKLVSTLKDVLLKYNLKTTIRLNGGWVRDKVSHLCTLCMKARQIMGLESDDIDVSLDDMCGEDFAKLIVDYINNTSTSDA